MLFAADAASAFGRLLRESLNIWQVNKGPSPGFQVLPVTHLSFLQSFLENAFQRFFLVWLFVSLPCPCYYDRFPQHFANKNSTHLQPRTPWELELHFCCSSLMWYLFEKSNPSKMTHHEHFRKPLLIHKNTPSLSQNMKPTNTFTSV